MKIGISFLVLGYVLSQFYRAFLAVLSPFLVADTGARPDDLALASGMWFLAFAAMQLPVGWALDRIGPRRTVSLLLGGAGGGGAIVLALAQGPLGIHLGMILLGVGCAPVLMAAFYIFARTYPAAIFATLAGVMIGVGSVGNVAAAWPLAWAAEVLGWRTAVMLLGAITAFAAVALWRLLPDPPRLDGGAEAGSLLDILRMPALWLILPLLMVNYAPAAGLRGLWIGPYYDEVFGATARQIGQVTLLMAFAMILGNFAYGPLDRLLGTRKGVVLVGNLAGAACLAALWAVPDGGFWTVALLLAGVGFFGSSFPVMMAHGRSFLPPHLLGRGVSFLNLFAIGGVGLIQLLSAPVHAAASDAGPIEAYRVLFAFFTLILLAGCIIYAFSRDRTD